MPRCPYRQKLSVLFQMNHKLVSLCKTVSPMQMSENYYAYSYKADETQVQIPLKITV